MNEQMLQPLHGNENSQESPKRFFPKDEWTLRVRGGDRNDLNEKKRPTDMGGLSRSILHVLDKNPDGFAVVQSVGPVAHEIVLAAYRLAKEAVEKRAGGVKLVLSESEYSAEIAGKRAKGISTRIWPIPIKHAL